MVWRVAKLSFSKRAEFKLVRYPGVLQMADKEQNENLIDDREAYRLPTDAEWSMAVGLMNESGPTPEARAGKIKTKFPSGKQWRAPNDAGNYTGTSGK